MQHHPRRSCLYVPGSNARAIEKTRSLATDAIIFDLEDAVAPDAKDAARSSVCAALSGGGFGRRELVVRINALHSQWGEADLVAVAAARPDALLIPKVMSRSEVDVVDAALTRFSTDMALWAMVETPLAILNMREIAGASHDTRLTALVMGTNDLASELRIEATLGRLAFQSALQHMILAARAFGLDAIDGVFNDIADARGFKDECRQGKIMGFDGKTLIHPTQIEECNYIFSPASKDIAHARAVMDAFADPAHAERAVITVNGKMTERLHWEQARRVLAIQEAISTLS